MLPFFSFNLASLFNQGDSSQNKAYYQPINQPPQISFEVVSAQVKEAETRAKEAEERALKAEKLQADLKEKIQAEEQARLEDEKRKLKKKQTQQAEGRYAGEQRDFEIAPGVEMTFCWCPPGEFMMGSPASEEGRGDDEDQVKVIISKGFWMGKTEVTQAQWQAVMGSNPSQFKGTNLPVESVSWNDTQKFLQKIDSSLAAKDGWKKILPTEAQWEYAARAGESWRYSGSNNLDEVAWFYNNSGAKTNLVGMQKSSAWGMHDMSGNVWEWCEDWYDDELVGGVDPSGAVSGEYRVFRGGSWCNYANNCRVAGRDYNGSTFSYNLVGFRVVRSSAP